MSLSALFYPKSIALIGASTVEGSVGNDIAKNLVQQGYKGKLYFVNPKGGEIYGHTLIKDLTEIEGSIDLAIIAIPGKIVPEALKQLITKKLKAAIVISAGFKEVGNIELELEIAKICDEHRVSLIGPNCLGIINPELHLNASFAPLMPETGPIAFISQSGAICASVLDYARQRGMGFSKFMSVGNKALIGELELLEYLYKDSKTKVIAMYVEQLKQVEELRQMALKVTRGKPHKPILILKAGRTAAGAAAASSHTGSMSGGDAGYNALFAQSGMIRAESISELFDYAECFADNGALEKNRVVVITNAGGPGVLTTDELTADGLQLAQLSKESQEELKSFLPPAASVKNPVDILGDANSERYGKALEVVLADDNVDAVQVILTPQSMTDVDNVAKMIVKARKKNKKPLLVTFMGQKLVEAGLDILHENHIATTMFPESGAKSLGALYRFYDWLKPRNLHTFGYRDVNRAKVANILEKYNGKATKLLSADDAFAVLSAYNFPVIKRKVVKSKTEAEKIFDKLQHSVVLKIVSPDISHKSDVGGVMLNVEPKAIGKRYGELMTRVHAAVPHAQLVGVEVMEMVKDDGLEIIIGATTDTNLGKQILVGLGGIYTEALQDVAWGLAPLTHTDVSRMLESLKSNKILAGIRGQGPLAADVVEECLGRVSMLVSDFPQIKELDINPLKVLDKKKGAVVLDARIILM